MKGIASAIPNQEILTDTLGLQEAKHSSEIENIVTTHDELVKGDVLPEAFANPATKEVLRYRQALRGIRAGPIKRPDHGESFCSGPGRTGAQQRRLSQTPRYGAERRSGAHGLHPTAGPRRNCGADEWAGALHQRLGELRRRGNYYVNLALTAILPGENLRATQGA
ncbi:Fic/DOC family N-terminal domain-containing protein [Variovorax sp. dw_308]|uniref:Fic/DOC family N-terminal domain-containing protein n=1 Tax=Variovorax sp. dw_308 TaxID=2721546 RepID=UPI0021093242|nr:Fic/DOC family N-terminal domain-containing protein [Variovorax sp. dw_308]